MVQVIKRLAIPSPPSDYPELREMLTALKSNIDRVTVSRNDKLAALPSTATLADVIVAVNKIIARIT